MKITHFNSSVENYSSHVCPSMIVFGQFHFIGHRRNEFGECLKQIYEPHLSILLINFFGGVSCGGKYGKYIGKVSITNSK